MKFNHDNFKYSNTVASFAIYFNRKNLASSIINARRVDNIAAKYTISSKTLATRAWAREEAEAAAATAAAAASHSRRKRRRTKRRRGKNIAGDVERETRWERRSSTRCGRSCTARRKESGSSTLRLCSPHHFPSLSPAIPISRTHACTNSVVIILAIRNVAIRADDEREERRESSLLRF